jgi:hypothetical protein
MALFRQLFDRSFNTACLIWSKVPYKKDGVDLDLVLPKDKEDQWAFRGETLFRRLEYSPVPHCKYRDTYGTRSIKNSFDETKNSAYQFFQINNVFSSFPLMLVRHLTDNT